MANTSQNSNNRVERRTPPNPMARFSIGDDDDDAPLASRRIPNKRPRFGEPTSQSEPQPQPQRPQRQRVVPPIDEVPESEPQRPQRQTQVRRLEEEEEEEELVSIEEVDSDSQGFEEEEVEEEEDDGEDIGSEDDDEDEEEEEEAEPAAAAEGHNQQQLIGANTAASHIGQVNDSVSASAIRRCIMRDSLFGNSSGTYSSGSMLLMLTDPDVLDCPICLDPLCSPIFQCENGHIACASCCGKVKRKCPSCCMPIGYNRCRAMEKVIESVKVNCKNLRFGCVETISFSKKNEHELVCSHSACFCPHSSCAFAGSSKSLYLHFGSQHASSATRFTYNSSFTIYVEKNQKHMILQEQHESVLFILNHAVQGDGRVFNVDCIGPSTLKRTFTYHLTAKCTETSLSIQSVPEIYAKWWEHTPKKNYLTVPSDFSGYSGRLTLQVCIEKAPLLM